MGEQGKPFTSNLCNHSAVKDHPGSGANAVSRADTVFHTTPLSEVVWSPRRGLTIKCTDSHSIEKKAPVLWCTDTFNIIVASPTSTDDRKSGFSKVLTGEDTSQTRLEASQNSHKEIYLLGSPRSTAMVPYCPTWSNEPSPGNFQVATTLKARPMDIGVRDNPSLDREEATLSRNKHPNGDNVQEDDTLNSRGPEVGQDTDFLCHGAVVSNLANMSGECKKSNKKSSRQHIGEDPEANSIPDIGQDEILACYMPVSDKWNTPKEMAHDTICKGDKDEQPEHVVDEDCYKGLVSSCRHLCPENEVGVETSDSKCEFCRRHTSVLMEYRSDNHNQAVVLIAESSSKSKENIHPVCHMENIITLQSPSATGDHPEQFKGKEKVLIAEITKSISKEKEGFGSFKSRKNVDPYATGKRVLSNAKGLFIGSKRMKKSNEDSCLESHEQEDSSFVNRISSVSKGFFEYDRAEAGFCAPVPNLLSGKQKCFLTMPNDNSSNIASRNLCLASTFKGFYLSRLLGKSKKSADVTHLRESAGSEDGQLEILTMRRNTNQINLNDEEHRLPKPTPTSSMQIIDQGASQSRELLPAVPANKPDIQEKPKDNNQRRNRGSSSFSLNGSSSPSEGKRPSKASSFIPNKSSNLSVMKKNRIPSSVWITRFLPKEPASLEHHVQHDQDTFLESTKRNNTCNLLLQHSQNDINAVKDCQNSQDCHHLMSEDKHLQKVSFGPMGSSSKKGQNDLKIKSNLIPILPSEKLKQMKPSASVFAKRLDAFRHIQTSEIVDDIVPENGTCFFCGKSGHLITSCSEASEYELEHIFKNINLLASTENSVFHCIRCFQYDHWAVMCPHASMTSHQHVKNNDSVRKCDDENFSRLPNERKVATFPSDSIQISENVENQKVQMQSAHRTICGNISRNVADSMLEISCNVDKSILEEKQIASVSRDALLGNRSWVHHHDLVIKKKPNEQKRIFEKVRKLHLSRSGVIRWMESSNCHISLEGFFLRVRLGKWEEGTGLTCYHVACINGPLREKVHEGGRSCLPVNIGESKCMIDSRFVSNHNFLEDELEAWWFATIEGGNQPPTEVDLDKKLEEREALHL